MEGQELPVYNSDSGGEEQVDIDGLSDEMNIEGGVNGAGGNRLGWINWFCALEGHEFLVEIDEDFIRDPFNIYGLQTAFPNSNK
jgi:casein kinase II subunit beta